MRQYSKKDGYSAPEWPQNVPADGPESLDDFKSYGHLKAESFYRIQAQYFSHRATGTLHWEHLERVYAARKVRELNAEITGVDPRARWLEHVNEVPELEAEITWGERLSFAVRRFLLLAKEVWEK